MHKKDIGKTSDARDRDTDKYNDPADSHQLNVFVSVEKTTVYSLDPTNPDFFRYIQQN